LCSAAKSLKISTRTAFPPEPDVRRRRRGIEAFFDNLRGPMPIGRKLQMIIRNRVRIPVPACCGHPGEPGC
jgi:hypothetical protein